jgi:hypothetical protein
MLYTPSAGIILNIYCSYVSTHLPHVKHYTGYAATCETLVRWIRLELRITSTIPEYVRVSCVQSLSAKWRRQWLLSSSIFYTNIITNNLFVDRDSIVTLSSSLVQHNDLLSICPLRPFSWTYLYGYESLCRVARSINISNKLISNYKLPYYMISQLW